LINFCRCQDRIEKGIVKKYTNANTFNVCHGKLIILKTKPENIIKNISFDLIKKSLPLIEKVGILLTNKPLIRIMYPATKLRFS
jgi:hypothetical protein